MKITVLVLMVFTVFSCVQPTYERILMIKLDVSKQQDIKTVGIRGETPLSWRFDLPMEEIVKDSLYGLTLTSTTGYLFAECKFTVNGQPELKNKGNRKIFFTGDTTHVNVVFDVEK